MQASFKGEVLYTTIAIKPFGPQPKTPRIQLARLAPSHSMAKSSVLAFARTEDGERFRRLIEAHRSVTGDWPLLYERGFNIQGCR